MTEITNTRLRAVQGKKLEDVILFINSLPKVELKEAYFAKGKHIQKFVLPENRGVNLPMLVDLDRG